MGAEKMASQYDWIVVPDRASVKTVTPGTSFTYDLVNMTISEALVYQRRDWGINLGWSETPKYEWRFDPEPLSRPDKGGSESVPVMTLVGLYNSVEKDTVMYERRDWGINLKWYRDAGKHDKWGDLKDIVDKVKKAKEEIGEWIG
jgi:hypothetical protein